MRRFSIENVRCSKDKQKDDELPHAGPFALIRWTKEPFEGTAWILCPDCRADLEGNYEVFEDNLMQEYAVAEEPNAFEEV